MTERYKRLVEDQLAKFIGADYHPMELVSTVNNILRMMRSEGFFIFHDTKKNYMFTGLFIDSHGEIDLEWSKVNNTEDFLKRKMYSDFGIEYVGNGGML